MQRLRFRVQGSATEPYDIVAEGSGPDFRIFCSCPAGRRGGKFCKHVAALLVGDVTRLVEPSDDVGALRAMAAGTRYVEAALTYDPVPRTGKVGDPNFAETGVFDRDVASVVCEAERRGWVVTVDETGLRCFGITPTGRRQRSPKAWIEIDYDGTPHTPYHVTTPGPFGATRNVKNLSYAVQVFLETLPAINGDGTR